MQYKAHPSPRRTLELFKTLLFLAAAFQVQAFADAPAVSTHFSYSAPTASTVGLAGEFNSWTPAPMTKGGDGTWTIDVPLAPGEYGYKFIVNGNDWEFDPNNSAKKSVNGVDNSSITVPGAAAPAAPAPAAPASGDGVLFTYSNPSASSVFVAGQFNSWNTSTTAMQKDSSGTWTVRVPLTSGSYQYKLFVDGSWMLDPGNPQQADDGTGNMNSVKVVGPAGTVIAPAATPASAGSTPAPAAETAPPATSGDAMTVAGTQIQQNQINEFDIPLPPDTWRQTFLNWPVAPGEPRTGDDMRLKVNGVHVGIAVPPNFNPDKRWPMLIVCSAGGASNVDQLGSFYEVASDEGWVSMAADSKVDHSSDSNLIRWAGLSAALDYLHQKWPASKNWPVAVAGFDGGAKKSGYMAAMLSKQGLDLVGIWLGGVDEETPSEGMHAYNPPHVKYLHTPVFLSSGKADKGTPPETMRVVYGSLQSSGFVDPKLGTFIGGHEIDADQVKQGLDWFISNANAHPSLDN